MKKFFKNYETKMSQLTTELSQATAEIRKYADALPDDIPILPVIKQNFMFTLDHITDYVQGACNLIIANLAHEETEHVLRTKNKIEDYVRENFQKRITQIEICNHTGLSKSAFCDFFQKHYNCTFITYLTNYRIKQAVVKLKTSNESITNIAYECGFDSLNWFNVKFKEYTGMTPGMYRNQNNN